MLFHEIIVIFMLNIFILGLFYLIFMVFSCIFMIYDLILTEKDPENNIWNGNLP